jgi:hypothetical protein
VFILGMACVGFSGLLKAQGAPPLPHQSIVSRNPMLPSFEFRLIGPAAMMGRVDRQ